MAIWFLFALPAIVTIGTGTVAGLMHKTGFIWDIIIYRIIPILTIIVIALALAREFSPKFAIQSKNSSLIGMWISSLFLSLLTIVITGTTAFLFGLATMFYLGWLAKVLFVLVLLLWLALVAVIIVITGEFRKALIWGFKTDNEI